MSGNDYKKLYFSTGGQSNIAEIFRDVYCGVHDYHYWLNGAWNDVRQKYKASTLGPLWLNITTLITVSSLIFVYTKVLSTSLEIYAPYISSSYIIWLYISTNIVDFTTVFSDNSSIIKQIRKPYTSYIYKLIIRNKIIFVHNFIIYIIFTLIFSKLNLNNIFIFIFIFILFDFILIPLGIIVAVASTRFRDIPVLISSILQLIFLTTPILWMLPNIKDRYTDFIVVNPFYQAIEILRSPLLNNNFTLNNICYVVFLTAFLWIFSIFILIKYKKMISY